MPTEDTTKSPADALREALIERGWTDEHLAREMQPEMWPTALYSIGFVLNCADHPEFEIDDHVAINISCALGEPHGWLSAIMTEWRRSNNLLQ